MSSKNNGKRMIAYAVVITCLFLVSMGIKVPNLSRLHSPKPCPRAIIENASKTSQDATAKSLIAVELCDHAPSLQPPRAFRSTFPQQTCQFSSLPPSQSGARAPPSLIC